MSSTGLTPTSTAAATSVLSSASAPPGELQKFAPDSMIAGSVPLAAGANPLQVAYHAAAFALDSERVRVIYAASRQRVHYMAAAAADFAALPPDRPTGTALGAALEEAVQRPADALPLALLAADDAGTTAVVLHEGKLSSFRGYSALIEQQLRERYGELELRDVTQHPASHVWRGHAELQNAAARRLQRASLALACTLASAAALGLVWLNLLRGPGQQPAIAEANQALSAGMAEAVKRANAPMLSASYTFFEVQRLATLASDSGGRIVKFVQDNNRIAWELRLPLWVTQEMLTPLGSDIRVRREGDSLFVRRGILEREDESAAAAQRADNAVARQVKQGGGN